MSEYESGLTIHGVNWMCTGNLPEKIVWFIFFILMSGFALYMIQGYVRRYLSFEYRTEIRYEEKPSITLPTMLFCSSAAIGQLYTCYKDEDVFSAQCQLSSSKYTNLEYWTGSLEHRIGQYLANNCHAVNLNGSEKLRGKTQFLAVNFTSYPKPKDTLSIYPLTYNEYDSRLVNVPFLRDNKIELQRGAYDIYLSQVHTSRLPQPYSSNCTDYHLTLNIFSATYTESACFQNCLMNNMLQKCGDVIKIFKNLDSNQMLPLSNKTGEDRKKCFLEIWGKLDCHCPFSCTKIEYDSKVRKWKDKSDWHIKIFNAESKVTHIQEVPDYTLGDLLGDSGGILGLAIGASCLSVLELCVYFIRLLVHLL